MTRTELVTIARNYRRHTYCKVCGNEKHRQYPFCYDCYQRLPIDLQSALNRTCYSELNEPRIRAYCRAFVWLKAGPEKMNEYFPLPERW